MTMLSSLDVLLLIHFFNFFFNAEKILQNLSRKMYRGALTQRLKKMYLNVGVVIQLMPFQFINLGK